MLILTIEDPADKKRVFTIERNLDELLQIGHATDLKAALDSMEAVSGDHAFFSSIRNILEDQVTDAESNLEKHVREHYGEAIDEAKDAGATGNIGEARVKSFIASLGKAGRKFVSLEDRLAALKKKLRKAEMVEDLLRQRMFVLQSISKALGGQFS